jgi:hypothetical protein
VAARGGRAPPPPIPPRSVEIERALIAVAGNPRIHAMIRRALYSETARDLVDDFFESGLFDRFVDRLLASDGLWRIVDEVAESPSVTAAISGQGLGFADQIGGEVRTRSRHADRWLERKLGRGERGERGAQPESAAMDADRDAH